MTLLEAVQSLGIVELAAVSWINILPMGSDHVAVFTIALVLPFSDPTLPSEFQTGPRFWPDQSRTIDAPAPLEEQIRELDRSRILGKLEAVRLSRYWLIETHAGSTEERAEWLKSVILMEGRSPGGINFW
jgi:hypothetical protein